MINRLQLCCIIMALSCLACSKKTVSNKPEDGNGTATGGSTGGTSASFIKGADVSWLSQMENSGYRFYNSNGTEQDCMQILKNKGMNAFRLRVWVNPADGWCNTADVVNKAKRVKNLGMKLMIDFHYSDSWADPGKQTKPAAWKTLDFVTLKAKVAEHTTNVLMALKAEGITPEWVQVGNETNDGMLWEDGRASTHMASFAGLILSGYNAVKAVSTDIKVIVHISNGYDNALFRWMFDGLKANGAKWDIIGMSLYPTTANYATYTTQCVANANDMISRFGTPVMIVEVGMEASQPAACKDFLSNLIKQVDGIANHQGLGVFYWEPQSYNWQGYKLGAFDDNGKPTIALDAFAN
jgi:arabinogalactan endo-1,4-beta-galactosidase